MWFVSKYRWWTSLWSGWNVVTLAVTLLRIKSLNIALLFGMPGDNFINKFWYFNAKIFVYKMPLFAVEIPLFGILNTNIYFSFMQKIVFKRPKKWGFTPKNGNRNSSLCVKMPKIVYEIDPLISTGRAQVQSLCQSTQEKLYTGGRGWYCIVQLSTNYGHGCFLKKKKFHCTNSQVYSWLTTAQVV